MALSQIDRLQVDTSTKLGADVQRIQDRVVAAIRGLLSNKLVNGHLTDSVALTTSFQNIPHGLGREVQGWVVVSPDADARVWQDAAASNPDSAKFIRVRGSAAVNCRFWVF